MTDGQDRNAKISKLLNRINNDQLAIQTLSNDANDVSTKSKSSILLIMTDIFTALKTLADSVAGDYDSRIRKDPATKVVISATIVSNVEQCQAKSNSSSEEVRKSVLKIVDIRADLGTLKKSLQSIRAEVESEKAGVDQALITQNKVVAQADAARAVAQESYDKAKDDSDKAASNAKWWDEYVKDQPWWAKIMGGFRDNARQTDSQNLLWALRMKEAAKIDADILAQRQALLSKAQTEYNKFQVQASELDLQMAHLTHSEGVADQALQGCKNTITLCQDQEMVMLQSKTNTTKIRDRCAWLQELATRGDIVQTKTDFVDVLIDCVQFGVFDRSLVATGRAIFESLKAGDQTGILQQKDYFEKVSRIGVILTGFDQLKSSVSF